MARQLTPALRNNILMNMTSNRPIPYEEPAPAPVEPKYGREQRAAPVERTPMVAQPINSQRQRAQPFANQSYGPNPVTPIFGQQRQQPQQRYSPFGLQQQGFQHSMEMANLNRSTGMALQNAGYGSRTPMFSQNFAGPYDQMRAGYQGSMNTLQRRQRPFSNYYAGPRQGRGGAQPVASPEDASRRQQMQEMAARRNRFANQIGDRRGRTLQRRNVFG
jgi:hypothetical protein